MKKGRLGLESARVPHRDRHGIVWLARGELGVRAGTLTFKTVGYEDLEPGEYDIPYQMVSCVIMGPGSTVTHDAMRLLARHGTGLIASGEDDVRCYASMPFGPDMSALARAQVRAWTDFTGERRRIVRDMYAIRLGEELDVYNIDALRGIEGARVKESYKVIAARFGISWQGREYDRADPGSADDVNTAINHASAAVRAAAQVAVAACGAIPQLGFIHESSGISFCLDIADLSREELVLPAAFAGVQEYRNGGGGGDLERIVRRKAGGMLRKKQVVSSMIGQIKELLRVDDGGGDE